MRSFLEEEKTDDYFFFLFSLILIPFTGLSILLSSVGILSYGWNTLNLILFSTNQERFFLIIESLFGFMFCVGSVATGLLLINIFQALHVYYELNDVFMVTSNL